MIDKQTFYYILESAVLSFDGVLKDELVNKYGINDKLAKAGISLCEYLKSIENY